MLNTTPERPLVVAAVPYLNAIPLYVGLPELLPQAKITYHPPSEAAKALRNGRADLGLVPVFSLLESGMRDFIALPDLGIACRGEVLSVYVGSKTPLEKIREIYLDPESRTSVALSRILAPVYFPNKIRYLATFPGYEKDIVGKRAGLIIGDRALQFREHIPYRLDLGKAWLDYTGFPFVFALWAIRRDKVSEQLVETLRMAAQLGSQKLDVIAQDWAKVHQIPAILAERYLKEHIHYRLEEAEHQGLKHFIQTAIAMELVHPEREIQFYDTHAYYRQSLSGKETLSL